MSQKVENKGKGRIVFGKQAVWSITQLCSFVYLEKFSKCLLSDWLKYLNIIHTFSIDFDYCKCQSWKEVPCNGG